VKIDGVEVVHLRFDYPDRKGYRYAGGVVTSRSTTLIRVTTDTGQTGWGSAYSHPDLVRVVVEGHLRPHLIGEDPMDAERLWEKMYALTRWYGRKGAGISALGGVDIALWDLRGQELGKPVYELLGGRRDSVPVYASGLFWADDVCELEAEAARYRDAGFTRVKTRLGKSFDYDVAAVEAIQRGIGAGCAILVDGSHRYSLAAAIRFADAVRDRPIFWFEEPFPPEDLDSYIELRQAIRIPVAAGENEFGVQGFRELLRAGAIDIAQADACRAGGITECRRIAQLAADHGTGFAPHTWSDAVALIANAHLAAAAPHGLTVEMDRTGNPFIDSLLSGKLTVRDGLLSLPEGPGLGIEVDPDALARMTVPAGSALPDGNYSDLIVGRDSWEVCPPYGGAALGAMR
jgi:D-galactarolactone cycloisomerase